MQYSKPSKASLQAAIAHQLPAAQAAGCFSALEGLSGGSLHFKVGQRDLVARCQPESPMPGVSLHRQYRALKKLPAGIGPEPVCLAEGWLIVEWLAGEVRAEMPSSQALSALLYRLHRQPLFGWRITLLPLLEYYWQQASPARRSLPWLRLLKSMRRRGEPKPLRLAPLHMDVHPGNLVQQRPGLRLIDWEYAGDGDIALELAAVTVADEQGGDELLRRYARFGKIEAKTLRAQVTRWRPWVMMLMASWYECRWQQTQDKQFITLADEAWSLLRAKNQ